MDITNCSTFYATDITFEQTAIGTCNTSLIAFYFILISLIVLRFVSAIKKVGNYYEVKKVKNLTLGPIGVCLSFSIACSYTLVFILVLTNVANVYNGLSFSVYTIAYVIFAVLYFRWYLRLVHLGARIIKDDSQFTASPSLERVDTYGRALLSVAGVSLFIGSVVLIIISPIIPSDDLVLGTIGWAMKGIYQSFITFGIIWQMQRCYIVIQEKMPNQATKVIVLKKLRTNQIHFSFFGLGLGVYYLILATHIIPWTWYSVIAVTVCGETIAATFNEFKHERKPSSSSSKPVIITSSKLSPLKEAPMITPEIREDKENPQFANNQSNSHLFYKTSDGHLF